MDEHTLHQLCRRYPLGAPTAPPERVFGGLRHRIYHLRTQDGEYAVKILSPESVAEPGARTQWRLGERIAAAVAEAGLPAVPALAANGEVLQEVGPLTVLTYRWVEGQALSFSTPAGPHRAGQIGHILGRMHGLSLGFPELQPPLKPYSPDADWQSLVEEAEAAGCAWATHLRSALPDLSRWGEALAEAQERMETRWVISHGDLHQQNVLWSDEHAPWLIDWEQADWQQSAREATVSALEWSGFVEGDPDLASFQAFLQAYRREAPLSAENVTLGLRACFANWLGWLQFCTERALRGADPEERTESEGQIAGTLATTYRAEANFPILEAASRE